MRPRLGPECGSLEHRACARVCMCVCVDREWAHMQGFLLCSPGTAGRAGSALEATCALRVRLGLVLGRSGLGRVLC